MAQNGQNDHFGQNDLIPNRILAFVHFGLKRSILVHLGPPTVLWPLLILFKVLGSVVDMTLLSRGATKGAQWQRTWERPKNGETPHSGQKRVHKVVRAQGVKSLLLLSLALVQDNVALVQDRFGMVQKTLGDLRPLPSPLCCKFREIFRA